jgi:hypothetical protein
MSTLAGSYWVRTTAASSRGLSQPSLTRPMRFTAVSKARSSWNNTASAPASPPPDRLMSLAAFRSHVDVDTVGGLVPLRGGCSLVDQLLVAGDQSRPLRVRDGSGELERAVEVALHRVARVGHRSFHDGHADQPAVVGRQPGHESTPSVHPCLLVPGPAD